LLNDVENKVPTSNVYLDNIEEKTKKSNVIFNTELDATRSNIFFSNFEDV
jgi:hypothetical protein